MRLRISDSILAIASAETADVRYDTPAHSVSPDVVTATAIGVVGPVGTPRTYGGTPPPSAARHSALTLSDDTPAPTG